MNAFEYYDTKNRERTHQIKEMLQTQRAELSQVNDIMSQVKTEIQQNESAILY